jgi:uncharacterized delta-60 repeat protein
VTGLSSGAGHLFQVAAVNAVGTSSYSSVTTACTQTCARDDGFNINAGSGANGTIFAVAVQTDGKIIYSGSFTTWSGTTVNRLVRLNANGTLDTAFTANTGTGLSASAENIEIQSDGKIILVGSFQSMNGVTVNRVVRLNSDGTRDTVFSANTGSGSSATVQDAKVQPDGKIVFVGTQGTWNGSQVGGVFRLNSDGTRDAAFTTNVGTGADVGSGANHIGSIAIDTGGKIVFSGQFTTWNGESSPQLRRLNSDGTSDTAFQTAIGAGPSSRASDIAIQSDGKLVLVGQFSAWNSNIPALYRIVLLSTGALDTTFLNSGFNAVNTQLWGVAIDSSGRKIFVGDSITYGGTTTTNGVPVGYHFRQN